jgi:hypothetical protein
VVAFSNGDPTRHIAELFRALEINRVPIAHRFGLIFEPEWLPFLHEQGLPTCAKSVRWHGVQILPVLPEYTEEHDRAIRRYLAGQPDEATTGAAPTRPITAAKPIVRAADVTAPFHAYREPNDGKR